MNIIIAVLYIIAFFCAIFGVGTFFLTMGSANSAVQESSGSAMALAIAVIPYCAARTFDEFVKNLMAKT